MIEPTRACRRPEGCDDPWRCSASEPKVAPCGASYEAPVPCEQCAPAAEVVAVAKLENESRYPVPRIVALRDDLKPGTLLYAAPAEPLTDELDALPDRWESVRIGAGSVSLRCALSAVLLFTARQWAHHHQLPAPTNLREVVSLADPDAQELTGKQWSAARSAIGDLCMRIRGADYETASALIDALPGAVWDAAIAAQEKQG